MAFCEKCGTKLPEGANNCPNCGAPVNGTATNTTNTTEEKKDFSEKVSNLNNTPDTTAEFDEADIKANKAMAILAYLGILVLVPIFAAKDSKYARFHANQGLILCILELACSILAKIIPVVGFVFSLVDIAVFVLAIIGLVNACKDRAKELPIVGKYRILK